MPSYSRAFTIYLFIANDRLRAMVTADDQPAQTDWTADLLKVKEPR